MCGIHLVLTRDTYATRTDDFMKDCFIANQVRGVHSSGLFQVSTTGQISTVKRALSGTDFIELGEAKNLLNSVPRARLTVGHVRHKTQGDISDKNAHPFLVTREDGSQLVGVHNGSLRDWKLKKESDGIDVDSAWAFKLLATEGPVDAFEYFSGPYCFVWYDTRHPDTMFVARNDERPFHFCQSKDGKTMLAASELGMLAWLAERNKLDLRDFDDTKTKFLYAEAGQVYKFSTKNIGDYTQYDAPKYDPDTTIKREPAFSNQFMRQQDRWNPHGQGSSWVDDDGYGGDDMPWGYPRPPGWVSAQRSGNSYDSFDKRRMDSIIDNCKTALRHARLRNDAMKGPLGDAITTALAEAAEEQAQEAKKEAAQSSSPFQFGGFVGKPNSETATSGEIAKAKELGIFGQMVEFSGIMFDDELTEVLGNARYMVGDKKVKEIDATVRHVPKRFANHTYINSIRPALLTVVGYHVSKSPPLPDFLILSRLTDDVKQLIRENDVKTMAN